MSALPMPTPEAEQRLAVARVTAADSPVVRLDFLTWQELAQELTTHRAGPKDGPGWMPAEIRPGPRKGDRVQHVSALALDIEATAQRLPDGTKRPTGPAPPALSALAAELDLWGVAAILATSHSHEEPAADGGTLGPRYRVTIKLSRPIKPDEVRLLALHVAARLGVSESVDTSCMEPARLFYLPRCPADRMHLADSATVQGEPLDVDDMLRAAQAAKKPRVVAQGQTAGVIEAFNAAHDLPTMLDRHGYERARGNRWLWPGSTTGMPGVVFIPETQRVFSAHTADPLHAGDHSRDAFDAWCALEHGGDVRAATREAARILGMGRAPQAGKPATTAPAAPLSAMDRTKAIEAAREALAPSLKDRKAPVYPMAALGPLAAACEAITTAGQVQPAMVGQALLGAASLLTQGLFNVETLNGNRPLSLYLLTLGNSGDGKSTAQGAALARVTEWQRQQAQDYRADLQEYERAKSNRKKGDDPPQEPQRPFRLVGDATVEALRGDLDKGVCSQGVFTDEAAAILSGYGMSPDHRSKTAGVYSKLWDNGHLSVSRVTGGRVERYGRRIALHWLIQPMAASEAIGDPLLSHLGFWPRFLPAWPEPQAPRLAQPFMPGTLQAVVDYWKRCDDLLAEALPDDATDCPVLPLSADARALLGGAFERFERDSRRGSLKPVMPFGLRASEQACRVAGVLAAFAGHNMVSVETMQCALALVAYSLQTWLAFIDEGATDQRGADALRLYEWLTERPGWTETLAFIVNSGPVCVRSKDKRDAALAMLESVGLVSVADRMAVALVPQAAEGTAP